jgi:hypothetical protein
METSGCGNVDLGYREGAAQKLGRRFDKFAFQPPIYYLREKDFAPWL